MMQALDNLWGKTEPIGFVQLKEETEVGWAFSWGAVCAHTRKAGSLHLS